MTAALQRTAELTILYAGQRVQFGQPIARFQAVQAHLARLASEAQRAAVVEDAAQAAQGGQDDPRLDLAVVCAARTLSVVPGGRGLPVAHRGHWAVGGESDRPRTEFLPA